MCTYEKLPQKGDDVTIFRRAYVIAEHSVSLPGCGSGARMIDSMHKTQKLNGGWKC